MHHRKNCSRSSLILRLLSSLLERPQPNLESLKSRKSSKMSIWWENTKTFRSKPQFRPDSKELRVPKSWMTRRDFKHMKGLNTDWKLTSSIWKVSKLLRMQKKQKSAKRLILKNSSGCKLISKAWWLRWVKPNSGFNRLNTIILRLRHKLRS